MRTFRAGPVAVALAFAVAVMPLSPLSGQNTFGARPGLTFGGTGIPNNAVVSNNDSSSLGLLLGLSATQRCGIVDCGPLLTNDGVNTFFATPGISNNPPSPGNPYGVWNFDLAVVGANVAKYSYKLFYDFNPAVGNSGLGTSIIGPTPFQDSWNLGMDFLTTGIGGLVFPPVYTPYDPNANGQYYFKLAAYDPQTGNQLAFTDMNVDVGSVVPEPGIMSMMAIGLVSMAGVSFHRRKRGMKTPQATSASV